MNHKEIVLFADIEELHGSARIKLPEQVEQEGGILKISGGAVIDANLHKTSITVQDKSMLILSALSVLTACVVKCHDVVLGGEFSGELHATGSVQIEASATIKGKVFVAGQLLQRSMLADTVDMTVKVLVVQESHQGSEHVHMLGDSVSSMNRSYLAPAHSLEAA